MLFWRFMTNMCMECFEDSILRNKNIILDKGAYQDRTIINLYNWINLNSVL